MTKEEREVMRMALEALEDWDNWSDHTPKKTTEAIIAIDKCLANEALERKAENARELGLDYEPNTNEFNPDWDEKLALTEEVIRLYKRIEELEAQPEQEPVGEMIESAIYEGLIVPCVEGDYPVGTKLYLSPPQRKPLTDEEIRQVMKSLGWTGEAPSDIKFARAIEAAHGIKGEA